MPDADPAQIWSAWFRPALDASGKSQAEVADQIGMTTGNVSKWYTGKGYAPRRIEDVIAVAHALGQPDATEALEAASMPRAAGLIRQALADAAVDPVIAHIRAAEYLSKEERDAMVEGYRRAQQQTIHYFELQLAEAARRRHAERDRRTRRETSPERAAQ